MGSPGNTAYPGASTARSLIHGPGGRNKGFGPDWLIDIVDVIRDVSNFFRKAYAWAIDNTLGRLGAPGQFLGGILKRGFDVFLGATPFGFAVWEEIFVGYVSSATMVMDGVFGLDPDAEVRFSMRMQGMREHFAHMSASEWGSMTFDFGTMFLGGGGAAAKLAQRLGARMGAKIGGTVSKMVAKVGISAPRSVGRAPAIFKDGARLSARQARLLEQLPEYGSSVIVPKRTVRPADLSALTASEGVEFAMFTRGPQRMVMRGNSRKVPIGLEEAESLASAGWRWSAHTQPGIGPSSLKPAWGDQNILDVFFRGGTQEQSMILNSIGGYRPFPPSSLWIP